MDSTTQLKVEPAKDWETPTLVELDIENTQSGTSGIIETQSGNFVS